MRRSNLALGGDFCSGIVVHLSHFVDKKYEAELWLKAMALATVTTAAGLEHGRQIYEADALMIEPRWQI